MQIRHRIAYGSVPKDGGTFTFYRNISPFLKEYGILMYCVSVGRENALLWENNYADEYCVSLAENTYNVKKQAIAFTNWCKSNKIDMVMGINSIGILSSIPHLPKNIRVVSRCANSFDHGYKITLSGLYRVHAIFAISKRLQTDLINKYSVDKEKIFLIDNGIKPDPYINLKRKFNKKNILELGFVGRLENIQKGIFHIPKILHELDNLDVPFKMTIVGKGKHEGILRKQLKKFIDSGHVVFRGAIDPKEIPSFLKKIDIFVFPSHFEGVGNALLEAMVAGCVCFTWLIEGLTDFVIDNKKTGFIHNLKDYKNFAKNIKILNEDRELLKEISVRASQTSLERFSPKKSAANYAKVLIDVMNQKIFDFEVKDWSKFKIDENFVQPDEKYFPRELKKLIKEYLLKLGLLN